MDKALRVKGISLCSDGEFARAKVDILLLLLEGLQALLVLRQGSAQRTGLLVSQV